MKTRLTINALFEQIWAEHWNTERFIASGWAVETRRLFERLIAPTFGEKQQQALTAAQIRAWHVGLAATPLQANRALGVLSKMLSFAEEMEWRLQGANPCKLVKPYVEKKRKRFASDEEIFKLNAILEREAKTNSKAVAFVYILILSGARPRSIERSTWNDLEKIQHENQTFGLLTFSGKSSAATGEEEQVIIPPQAMRLLKAPKEKTETLIGIKMPKDFWIRIRKEAGCEDLQIRDLRRTFATVGLSNGVGIGVIGELLNHKSQNTTKIYAKLMNLKRIEATKEIANHMTRLLKGSG